MAKWTGDGTQDPGPPPLHADPLSGLVTGGRQEQEAMRVRVVEPSLPDISAVREAMQAVLGEDSDLLIAEPAPAEKVEKTVPAPRPETGSGPATSELPKVSGSNGSVDSSGAPPAAAGREPARQKAESAKPAKPARPAIPAQRMVPPAPQQRRGFSPGLAAVAVLLLVIAVLAIVAISSLIDTIASLFS